MIHLKNSFMRVSIDESNNANVVSMAASDGFNILDKRGLCSWLKSGERQDPATGVLSNFFKTLFIEPMELAEQSANSAVFSRTVDGLKITKRITLNDNILKVEFSVRNGSGVKTPQMQVEHFNMFAGGRLPQRGGIHQIHMPLHQGGEGRLRMVAGKLPEQIRIRCIHYTQSIATDRPNPTKNRNES